MVKIITRANTVELNQRRARQRLATPTRTLNLESLLTATVIMETEKEPTVGNEENNYERFVRHVSLDFNKRVLAIQKTAEEDAKSRLL